MPLADSFLKEFFGSEREWRISLLSFPLNVPGRAFLKVAKSCHRQTLRAGLSGNLKQTASGN